MKTKGTWGMFLGLLLLCIGCTQQTDMPLLSQAEACIDSAPDSALQLLRQVPHPETLTGQAEADYNLLMTQATHKNDLPFTDSLVSQALPYFTAHHQPLKAGKCHFYKGVLLRTNQPVEAMQEYQQALDLIEPTGDLKYTGMCYEYIANVMTAQGMYTEALTYDKKALSLYINQHNTYSSVYAYKHIGVDYAFIEQYDSTLYYFGQALSIIDKEKQGNEYSALVNNYGLILCLTKDIKKALSLFEQLNKFISDPILRNQIYNSYGYILYKNNQTKEAKNYLFSSIYGPTKEIKITAHHLLYTIYKGEKDYYNAMEHLEKLLLFSDSLQLENRSTEIAELEKKYNYEKAEIVHQAAIQKKNGILIILSLLFLLFTVGTFIIIQRQRYRLRHEKAISEQLLRQKDSIINSYEEQITENQIQISKLKEKVTSGTITVEEIQPIEDMIECLAHTNEEMTAAVTELKTGKENLQAKEYRKAIVLYDQLQLMPHQLSEQEYALLTGLFNNLYPALLQKLKQADLTKSEVEVCVLFGLGMNNQLVMRIRSIQLNSVLSFKSHIRKKLTAHGLQEVQKALLE